jgi:fimbrial chaperone protein
MSTLQRPALRAAGATALLGLAALLPGPAAGAEFSVSPIRVELKPGAMSETITVTNHAAARLRAAVKLFEWTQDAAGNDVYKDSTDLIFFPRQIDMDPDSKRLVRVGLKTPAGVVERAYRLFIEEEPAPGADQGRAQVAFYFRFGVPIFVPPATARPQPQVGEPTLSKGKLSLVVRNTGNQNFRLVRLSITDGAAYRQDLAGWYSLANTERTYTADIPPDVCRRAGTLSIAVEGEAEGVRFDRKLHVDPASCG